MFAALGLAFALVVTPVNLSTRLPEGTPGAFATEHIETDAYARGRAAYMRAEVAEAIRLYRLAASQGDTRAMTDLGNLYRIGQGVPRNPVEAVRWQRLAADLGDTRAMTNLGVAYLIGEGVPKDEAEANRWFRLAADQNDALAALMLPPPVAAPEVPEISAEAFAGGSLETGEADTLRPGRPLFDVEMRADCSVYYRGTLVHRRTADEYGEDGNCEYLPTVHRSPSGRWIAVHTPLDNYSNDQLAVIDTVAQAVAVPPRRFTPQGRLYPLNTWSADENFLLMQQVSFMGPPIAPNDQYQLTIVVPCDFNIAGAGFSCLDKDRFAAVVQAAALRASPLARCLPNRTCFLAMEVRDDGPEADGFAFTGVVQLKRIAAGADSMSPVTVTETFDPGEDIVWFEFSEQMSRAAPVRDMTLRVVRP